MAHSSADCAISIMPTSASGAGFRELPTKLEGERGAGVSHGKIRSKERKEEVSDSFKQPALA